MSSCYVFNKCRIRNKDPRDDKILIWGAFFFFLIGFENFYYADSLFCILFFSFITFSYYCLSPSFCFLINVYFNFLTP